MNFDVARTQMLGQQLRAWEVLDDRVLRAFAETPREEFRAARIPRPRVRRRRDPVRLGQTMLAPKVEGRVLQALQVEPIDEALIVGTGSGYLAACLARLAKRVTSVDIFPEFATAAAPKLGGMRHSQRPAPDCRRAELDSPRTVRRDRRHGLRGPTLDEHFVSMLRPQGRLFIVVGRKPAMEARLITLQPDGTTTTDGLFETVLAPLINAERPEPFVL